MRFVKVIIFVLLTISLLSVSCHKGGPGRDKRPKERMEPLEVSVEKVKKELIELVIDSTGTFFPFEESNVAFEVDGKIVNIAKDIGDYVKKGEVLASISSEEYVLKKAQAEADFKNAESELKRVEELFEKKFATEQQLDIARRNLNVAKAQFDLAQKKLNDCQLKAPISGFVSKRMINAGEYARTGMAAFYLVNTSTLKFKTEISERYSDYVRVDDRVVINTDSGIVAEGSVYRISPSVNPDSRAFVVEVRVENKKNVIKPGSFGRAKVYASYKYSAITISENAVSYFSGTPRVFKIVDSKAVEQVIKLGDRIDRRFVVESGINEGDIIATSLVDVLTNNQAIRVKE